MVYCTRVHSDFVWLQSDSKWVKIEFFTVYTKLAEMAVFASEDLTTAKKLPPVGFNLMQEIITDLGVQCLANWVNRNVLFMGSLNFCSCTTWFLDLNDLVRINGAWLCKVLKVSDLQANASLAQLVRHWTLKPVIISCIRHWIWLFVVVVKSFGAEKAISGNFV